jgi:hypothetical protein
MGVRVSEIWKIEIFEKEETKMAQLTIDSSSVPYGLNRVQGNGKRVSIGDLVPTASINSDLQPCTPLYEAAGSRDYTYPLPCDVETYEVKVGPMGGADPTKYMLQTQHYQTKRDIDACTISGDMRMTLDLGTKNINVTELVTSVNANFMPGDSLYGSCLQTMSSDIENTWHSKNSYSDTTAVPGMQGPEEFIKCAIKYLNPVSIQEPSRKTNGIEKARAGSMATKIIIGPNSKIDPSAKMFDITGRPVRKSKVTPGLYIKTK